MAGSKIPSDTSPDVLENLLRYDESLRSEAQLRALRKKYGLDPATGVAAPGLLAPGARLNGDHPYWQAHPGQMTAAKVGMLPFRMGMGLVESAVQAATGPGRALRGEMSQEQMLPEALNFAGNVVGGSIPHPRPKGSIGMGGSDKWEVEGLFDTLSKELDDAIAAHATPTKGFQTKPVMVKHTKGSPDEGAHPYLHESDGVKYSLVGVPDNSVALDNITGATVDIFTPKGTAQYALFLNNGDYKAAQKTLQHEMLTLEKWGDTEAIADTQNAIEMLKKGPKEVLPPNMGLQDPKTGKITEVPHMFTQLIHKLKESGVGSLSAGETNNLFNKYKETVSKIKDLGAFDTAMNEYVANKYKFSVLPESPLGKIQQKLEQKKLDEAFGTSVAEPQKPILLSNNTLPSDMYFQVEGKPLFPQIKNYHGYSAEEAAGIALALHGGDKEAAIASMKHTAENPGKYFLPAFQTVLKNGAKLLETGQPYTKMTLMKDGVPVSAEQVKAWGDNLNSFVTTGDVKKFVQENFLPDGSVAKKEKAAPTGWGSTDWKPEDLKGGWVEDPPPAVPSSYTKPEKAITAEHLPQDLAWVDWDGNLIDKKSPEGLAKINAQLAGNDQGLLATYGPTGELVENFTKLLQKAKDGVPGYKLYMTTASGTFGGVKPQPAKQGLPGMAPEEINPAAFTDLPMDQASRMARAKELRYNTDQVVYHGMPRYEARRHNGLGFNRAETKNEAGIFTTTDPTIADSYANSHPTGTSKHILKEHLEDAEGQNIIPMYGRADNPKIVDWRGSNYGPTRMISEVDKAWQAGHDMLRIDNMYDVGGNQSQYVYRYPEQLRSVHAVFDPAYRNSPNLLRAGSGPAGQAIGSAAGQNMETWNFLRNGDPTGMGNVPEDKKSKKREPLRITVTPRKRTEEEKDDETK